MQHIVSTAHWKKRSATKLEQRSREEVHAILSELKVDWNEISYAEFARGLEYEWQFFLTAQLLHDLPKQPLQSLVQLVILRLREVPNYYAEIQKLEAEGRSSYFGL